MLHYALVFFLLIALIAGFLGFGGVVGAAVVIAKFLFFERLREESSLPAAS